MRGGVSVVVQPRLAGVGQSTPMGNNMGKAENISLKRLGPADLCLLRQLLTCYAHAFNEQEVYAKAPASNSYLQGFLSRDSVVVLVALQAGSVIGGLTAYELLKPEQQRSEMYLYDLAVAAEHRRCGVATALISELKLIAKKMGAYEVFVQADYEDPPAIALYSGLGVREDVLHFSMKT